MKRKANKTARRDRCRKNAAGHLWSKSWVKGIKRCFHCGDKRLIGDGRRYRVDIENSERTSREREALSG